MKFCRFPKWFRTRQVALQLSSMTTSIGIDTLIYVILRVYVYFIINIYMYTQKSFCNFNLDLFRFQNNRTTTEHLRIHKESDRGSRFWIHREISHCNRTSIYRWVVELFTILRFGTVTYIGHNSQLSKLFAI